MELLHYILLMLCCITLYFRGVILELRLLVWCRNHFGEAYKESSLGALRAVVKSVSM